MLHYRLQATGSDKAGSGETITTRPVGVRAVRGAHSRGWVQERAMSIAEYQMRTAQIQRLERELAEANRRLSVWEQKAPADKAKRINDLAAQYAGSLASQMKNFAGDWAADIAINARALAQAVVEAEE